MRPFHFLADAREPMPARALADRARHAEAAGYHAFAIPDHVMDQMSPVPAMAAIAAGTEQLRVMPFVLNNDLRHPAVVAQDLASIDVLSEGRLDVAIGAGWNAAEYEALGIAFEPQRVRSERLAEAVTVLQGCFAEGPFSFEGRHYRITDHDGGPKPVQRPHPPFMIGGGGRRTLMLAAREAQIVGLAPRHGRLRDAYSLTWEAAAEKVSWIREAAGDRFDDLTLNIYPTAVDPIITDDARGEARRVAEMLAPTSTELLTEDQVLESPHLFIGSLAGLEEKFLRLRDELGISSIMVGVPGPLDAIVERLAGR